MDGSWKGLWTLVVTTLLFEESGGFQIRNEELRKCVQVNEDQVSGRLSLQECRADSTLQEWHWNPVNRTLSNPQTGRCLTAPKIQDLEIVWLRVCKSEEQDYDDQTWSCSKKGLLTLHGKGLHLSALHDSSKLFLSKSRGKGSKWKTLANRTICEDADGTHDGQDVLQESQQTLQTGPSILTKIRYWHPEREPHFATKTTEETQTSSPEPRSSKEHEGPSVNVITADDFGMGWKMTMMLLSSLALLLGLVILILNIYQNRRKKTVVVLKSYTPTGEVSQPGSPVPSERAPLTQHLMKPAQSPSLQRGEILVEWKDGTVTPLFETYLTD